MTKVEKVNVWRKKNPEKVAKHRHTYYVRHKAAITKQKNVWRAKNRKKIAKQNAAWKKANPQKVRESIFKTRYGVPFSEFQKLFVRQGGLCAICKCHEAKHTDHNHITGKIRGILCGPCNWVLGLMDDSPERLKSAVNYLLS